MIYKSVLGVKKNIWRRKDSSLYFSWETKLKQGTVIVSGLVSG
jgi:hypothetical protein